MEMKSIAPSTIQTAVRSPRVIPLLACAACAACEGCAVMVGGGRTGDQRAVGVGCAVEVYAGDAGKT